MPLRPLTLGDLFGGATLTIRRNPGATVGTAALVTLAFMLVPIVVTLVLGGLGAFADFNILDEGDDPTAGIGINSASLVSGLFSGLAGIVVTGLVMRVVEQAVTGHRITGAEALRRVRGSLFRLVRLSLLSALLMIVLLGAPIGIGVAVGLAASNEVLAIVLGVVGGLVGVMACVFVYVRFLLLAAPNLVLEGHGVLASLRRAGHLSAGQFWRLFGIALLAAFAAGIVGQLVAVPFAILGVVVLFLLPGTWGAVVLLLASYLGAVVTGAITSPFTGGVSALQYYDQRFRKEGFDVELLNRTLGGGR